MGNSRADAHAPSAATTQSRRSAWQRTAVVCGWVAFAALAVPAFARVTGWEAGPLAILVALMPWMTAACVVPLLVGALVRSWSLAAASAALAALGIAWLAPLFVAAPSAGEPVLTVASVNMTYGGADPDQVVDLIATHEVDVLVAQELTPEAVAALAEAGLDDVLPHAQLAPEPGVTGTGLWSRTALTDAGSLAGFTDDPAAAPYVSRAVQAGVDVEGQSVTVLAVHPAAPGPVDHSSWDSSMASLTGYLADLDGAVLVAGDFNTTRDHRAFRDIVALGYEDAADQAGAGIAMTFPQGRTPVPLVAIDHALVRDTALVATGYQTHAISGADHRALVVTYATR
ncbi:endonuclease/exonuclease/phosphatase family protein [Demequina sp.]|uniref:endonuclease/exonuclease/phosphatase family protein n=1 Tax=Demequina sp. TaxID=2050685 RepID=UPI003A8AB631